MVTKPERNDYTVEEWLAHQEATDRRYDYIDGEIYAMSGGTLRHGKIAGRVVTALNNGLQGKGCTVYTSDVAVKISDTKYVYPDASALCGEPIPADEAGTMLANPTVVVEVVSKSSAYYDRGLKADYYLSVPSISAYLVIDQNRPYAILHTKQNNQWVLTSFQGIDAVVPIDSLDTMLALKDVYDGIVFEDDGVN
ncbi:MAG: Uma2 family endonuclease [Chloroflexota bacterium]